MNSRHNKFVLIFVTAQFTDRDIIRYGIKVYDENGLKPIVVDLSYLIYKRKNTYREHFALKVITPLIWKEVQELIYKLRFDAFVYTTTDFDFSTLKLYRYISKYKVPYIVNSVSVLPVQPKKKKNRSLPVLWPININRVMNLLLRFVPLKLLGISYANGIIVHGIKSQFQRKELGPDTKKIFSHTYDFDIAMELMPNNNEIKDEFAVYLDSYLPFHSDYNNYVNRKLSDLPNKIDPEIYYQSLNRFFDDFEKKTGLKVVIAAHPKSQIGHNSKLFDGRDVIINSTAKLVSQSRLIILEQSTALNFAVIFKKPMVFITSDQLIDQPYGSYTNFLAGLFGLKPINVNNVNFDDNKFDFNIDIEAYESYMNNYIKVNKSRNDNSWKIVSDFIKTNR